MRNSESLHSPETPKQKFDAIIVLGENIKKAGDQRKIKIKKRKSHNGN